MEPEKKSANARRVIKKGNRYICGICGKRHLFRKLAESCVETCLAKENSSENITNSTKRQKKKFRCSYCKRIYPSLEQARECVRLCKQKVNSKHEIEKKFSIQSTMPASDKAKQLAELAGNMAKEMNQSFGSDSKVSKIGNSFVCCSCQSVFSSYELALKCAKRHDNTGTTVPYLERINKAQQRIAERAKAYGAELGSAGRKTLSSSPHTSSSIQTELKSEPSAEERNVYQRAGNAYICRKCQARYPTRKEVVACYSKHTQEERGLKINAEKKAQGLSTTMEQAATQKSDAHKFIRDGTNYVCRKCNASYFTKEDVVKCFGGHDQDGSIEEAMVEAAKLTEPKKRHRNIASDVPEKDKFMRNGAKYVCKRCGEKHFTKIDVIQCFDSH